MSSSATFHGADGRGFTPRAEKPRPREIPGYERKSRLDSAERSGSNRVTHMIPNSASSDAEIQWMRRLSTAAGEPMAFAREFRLFVADGPLSDLVLDVLERLEDDVLRVYSPDDPSVFVPDYEAPLRVGVRTDVSVVVPSRTVRGPATKEIIGRKATLPVSIREWLPVGCQWIGLYESRYASDDGLGLFWTNAHDALFPLEAPHRPLGPVALDSKIMLQTNCIDLLQSRGEDAVRLIIAHELVHAFDLMRIAVPAVMDWETFWNVALAQGDHCEYANDLYRIQASVLDDYDNLNEFLGIADRWGSQADAWWVAYTGKPPPKK